MLRTVFLKKEKRGLCFIPPFDNNARVFTQQAEGVVILAIPAM